MKISILKLSLIISLIGIFMLLILTNILNPRLINIEEINNKFLNKKVQVQGTVFNIRSYEDSDFQIISIKDNTGKINIAANQISSLKNNQEIIAIGEIKEYNQHLQIQADKIILIASG